MAGVNSRTRDRERTLDFDGFLNNLQDWDALKVGDGASKTAKIYKQGIYDKLVSYSSRDLSGQNNKTMIAQAFSGSRAAYDSDNPFKDEGLPSDGWKIIAFLEDKENLTVISPNSGKEVRAQRKVSPTEVKKQTPRVSEISPKGIHEAYRNFSSSDATEYISSHLLYEESFPTAASEKELGNEHFKQRNFSKAIECYSRSIALSPSSVAFANRAMSYLKLKRYEEAEVDCTEALNLDDRYVKAYSRRATARKELGKLKSSLEDSEFALRLEPNNQELRKLYTETKALYDEEVAKKVSGAVKSTSKRILEDRISEIGNGSAAAVDYIPSNSQKITPTADLSNNERKIVKKQGQKPLAHELASRAASLATSAIPTRITTPRTAYELEVSWRLLSGDSQKQTKLLKSIPPGSLPQLFKNALSARMLIEIIRTTSTFFKEEMELAVSILDNLTKVPRFDMIIMCLSAPDRADLRRIWDEVFSGDAAPYEHAEAFARLRRRYCTGV